MRWLLSICLLSVFSVMSAAPALSVEKEITGPTVFWAGTKPVVWSLRSGTYAGRRPNMSRPLSAREEVAGSKPVLWSLKAGRQPAAQAQPSALQPSQQQACWGTKPVACSFVGRRQGAS